MSGDFRKYPELQGYSDLQSPHPGQYGTYWTAPSSCASDLMSPMACCCTPRRVSLTGDRSDFTREAFGGI